MGKKLIALILCLILALALAACGSSESTEPTQITETAKPTEAKDTIVLEAPPKETEEPEAPLSDSGALGDVEVTIGELEYVQDYFGDPAILIHFTFTNNSKENQSAMFSIDFTAYQNGVGLKDATILDDAVYDSQALSKEIQPGTTIELAEAYTLSSDTAPIEVIVSETFSFDGAKLAKTFEIAPGGTTVLSVAPGVENAAEIDGYAVSINSYNIAEGRHGEKVLILNMGYTNNSDAASPFYSAIDVTAFQDGIELEEAYALNPSTMDNSNNYVKVMPGVGVGVAEGFVLSSETSPVDIEIKAMFSFNDEKVTTQINIAE